MKSYLIKNKKFTHDEEIIDGLNDVEELSLGIKFYNRDLTFVFQSVEETYDYYKPYFFSRELKKKTGLDFYFTAPKIDDDFSAEEIRRLLKIAGYLKYTDWLVIRYEYETGNWYFEDFDKPINNDDCKNVLSALVDKIIDICEK